MYCADAAAFNENGELIWSGLTIAICKVRDDVRSMSLRWKDRIKDVLNFAGVTNQGESFEETRGIGRKRWQRKSISKS